jgi:hypothetical protein
VGGLGASILQYTDPLEKSVNLKLILCIFEQLSNLKVNFHKSEISVLEKHSMLNNSTNIFLDVSLVPYPCGTLEVPVHYRKLCDCTWNPVENRFTGMLRC